MKKFKHFDATSIEKAVSMLDAYKGKARVIAGGTDLLHAMREDCAPVYPEAVVNLKTIPNLSYIKEDAEGLKIGALTTLDEIAGSSIVQGKYTALSEAAHAVGSPHLRNMGTIAGNICQDVRCWYYRDKLFKCIRKGGTICYALTGDNRWYHSIFGTLDGCAAVNPSDTVSALVALNGKVKVRGPKGERTIPVEQFSKSTYPGTVLETSEIVTEVQVPTPKAGTKSKFLKFAIRKAIDFAIVNVAVAVTVEGTTVSDARVALGGVYLLPYRAKKAEEALKGKAIDDATAGDAAAKSVDGAVALTKNAYKVELVKTLVKRAVLACK